MRKMHIWLKFFREKNELKKRREAQNLSLDSTSGSRKNLVNRVLITSKLWGTVIAIATGIETSVNATESISDFSTISERDYRLKNTFEIINP